MSHSCPQSHSELTNAEVPAVIVSLNTGNSYFRSKAAELFGQLVNKPLFHEAIKAEIPAILALLRNDLSGVRATAAELFGKLVDESLFHDAIKAEIPAILALLSNDFSDVRAMAAKLIGKLVGLPAFHEVFGITRQDLSLSMESRIIVAEAALLHSRRKEGEIARIMSLVGHKTKYILQAGFNETLIQRSIGHLQEIYISVNTSISSNSPIFQLLGKAFSPFPGVVQMPTRSQLTPVFKEDGTEYDRNSLLLSRTETFHKDALLFARAVSKPDTKPLDRDAPTQSSRDGGNIVRSKTKGGPPGDGEASSGSKQIPIPSGRTQFLSVRDKELPPPPDENIEKASAHFEVIARIKTKGAKETHLLQIDGLLTSTVSKGRTASVQLGKLDFQSESYFRNLDPLYLRYVRVAIDTDNEGTIIDINKPFPTRSSDGKTVHIQVEEDDKANGATSQITARTTRLGVVWWDYTIQDQATVFLADKFHPDFKFTLSSGASDMQVEVASYWFSPPNVPSEDVGCKPLFASFQRRKKKTKQCEPLPYLNFCHAVKVNTPLDRASYKVCIEETEYNVGKKGDNMVRRPIVTS